jgi:hypothetical protein
MLAPLVYFARRYPLGGNSDKLLDIGQMSHYKHGEYYAFVGGMALLYVLYVLALRESRRLSAKQTLPAVFGLGTAFAATMVWMYPVSAVDVFTYAARSRLFTTYGVNPMVALVKNYPHDPWTHLAHGQWAGVTSPYGPLWNLIAAPITRLAGDRIMVALVGFKLLCLLCLLAGGWAIQRTLVSVAAPSPSTGALFYLWNPLVLWEGIGNAHNDIVMTLPLLLALLAWAKRRDSLVIPLLVMAALVKYVPALLIPVTAVALWRRAESWPARLRLAGWSLVLSLLAAAIALYPFYDLQAIRTSVAHQGAILRMSPPAMAFELLIRHYPGGTVGRWLRLTGEGMMIAVLAWQAAVLWRWPKRLPRACYEVFFVFLVFATWYFNAWYLIWPVALAALLPWGWPSWRTILWTVGALANYALVIWLAAWWHLGFAAIHYIGVPLQFGLALLLAWGELVWWVATWKGRSGHPRQQSLADQWPTAHVTK